MRQDEGSTAEWSSAHVCRLPEVQAAGQDHKVVCRDGRHPAGIPVVISRSDDLAPVGFIDSDLSSAFIFMIKISELLGREWGGGLGAVDLKALNAPETHFTFLLSYLLSGVPDTIKIIVKYWPNKYVHSIPFIGIFLQ